jgi:1-deoxy-D-xylulose-5-phosphate reductoisomerase
MRLPIAVAMAFPDRLENAVPPTPAHELGTLDFHPLDQVRFPAPGLARRAGEAGDGYPAVLNAVNEEAVAAFLAERLAFTDIVATVAAALDAYNGRARTLEEVMEADRWAREWFEQRARKLAAP